MHASVMQWVESIVTRFDLADREVLEVGSYDENGSVRAFFTDIYIGVDMRPGPGVDEVAHAHHLPFKARSFDVVVSTEMLEHDAQFWLSLPEMGRVLRPDGYMILTARGNGFPHHAFPNDYWRFMLQSAPLLLELASCTPVEFISDPTDPGIFALGRRVPPLT